MYITRHTDYSLRVLIYLAAQGGRLVTIQEIAVNYAISKNHLMKVVHELNKKGYIKAVRGKNGGLRLQLRPSDIRIGVLVKDMEPNMELLECFSPENQCTIAPVCGLKGILRTGLNAFFETLNQYTLDDVLPDGDKHELLQLLNIKS